MFKKITRTTSKAILLILSAIPVLFALSLGIKANRLHRKMRRELETSLLETIIVSKQDLHWVENGSEAMIQGRLFDVRSVEKKNETYYLSGFYDEEEMVFLELLKQNQQKKQDGNNALTGIFFQWLQSFFHQPGDDRMIAQIVKQQPYPAITPFLPRQLKIIFGPPPECLS